MAVYRSGVLKLDSSKSVFYSGQTVSGCVEFQFEVPITFSVLHVTFLGEAIVDWTEPETEIYEGQARVRNVSYLGREEYVNVTHILAGSYNSAPLQLSPGTYKYPFQFIIPPQAPSTFKADKGRVDYVIKVNMMFQGNPVIKEIVEPIDVIAPFDLNLGNERVKQPLELELEKEACGCFCSSDYVTVKFRLPVSGYCPGQVMPVEVDVLNKSGVEVTKIILQLVQRERYKTQRPASEYIPPEEVLVSIEKGAVMSHSDRTFKMEMKVPSIIVPNLENCSIIDVGYFIRAIVKLSGCNSDIDEETELCLGLVPLKETVASTYLHPLAHSLPDGPIPDQTALQNAPQEVNMNVQYPESAPVNPPYNHNSNYHVEMSQTFISSDPSKSYHIGFASSGPGTEMTQVYGQKGVANMPVLPNTDLRINLPPYPLPTPSAPPPST